MNRAKVREVLEAARICLREWELLRDEAAYQNTAAEYATTAYQHIEDALAALDDDGWVRCSERLPEPWLSVWLHHTNGIDQAVFHKSRGRGSDITDFFDFGEEYGPEYGPAYLSKEDALKDGYEDGGYSLALHWQKIQVPPPPEEDDG